MAEVTVAPCLFCRTAVILWLNVSNLLCPLANSYNNIYFYKVTFHQHVCQVAYLYWPEHWEKGCIWESERGIFFPFTYLDLALDRWWHKTLNWHDCRVKWGPLYGCCYASVHVSVNACLRFGTFMNLQFILARFIVILFMSFGGSFPGGIY